MQAFLGVLIIGLIVTACTPSREEIHLPAPEVACPVVLDWEGLVPGRSTQQDVIKTLGRPSQTGSRQFGDRAISFYAYPVNGGRVANFVQDRVFFRPDGLIDWMEIIVADRDGRFHPAQETIDQLGSTLDTAYLNNNYDPSNSFQYDVLGGPDQLYIWSECGLALDVHGICIPSDSGGLKCLSPKDLTYPRAAVSSVLTLRHSNPYPGDEPALLSADNAILMKFLFAPTSYKGFTEYYMHKVPFGLWDEYLRAIHAN